MVAFGWLNSYSVKDDEILYVQAFVLLHQGGKTSDSCHLMVKGTQGKICHTGRKKKGVRVRLCCSNLRPSPFPTSHSQPAPVPNTGAQEVVELAPLPYKDQLENPVLVSGAQGPGLVSLSKTWRGTQFGPGTIPEAGQFPVCCIPEGA